jgi:hypothetical protein
MARDNDDAEFRDREEKRSKRSQGHSALTFGGSGAPVSPRKGDLP